MKKEISGPSIDEKKRIYKLKSAVVDGYEYTKAYYKMDNGVPVKCENGDDSCLTIINIRKGGDTSKKKRTFIFSEGYVGAEKAYKEDGTKRKSMSRKDCFGISYFIKYIENSKEQGEENTPDNFHVMFFSNSESSENQACLYAKAIKDITLEEKVEQTYIWGHSKAGILTLRAFEKMMMLIMKYCLSR